MTRGQAKLVVFALAVLALGMFFYVYYPPAVDIMARSKGKGIVNALLEAIFLTEPGVRRAGEGPNVLPGGWLVWAILGIGCLMALIVWSQTRFRASVRYGSARHAGRHDMRAFSAKQVFNPFTALFLVIRERRALGRYIKRGEHRLTLGFYRRWEISLSALQQFEHLLLTGPTGKGKSSCFFIPNLLREIGQHSLVIGDIKGELYKVAAGWLSRHMQVWQFAPLSPKISAGYNPLAHVKSVEDALEFADAWVMNTGRSRSDDFWMTCAKQLIAAMSLHLLATEKNPPLSRLADQLTMNTLADIDKLLSNSNSVDVRRLAQAFIKNMSMNERMAGSILTDVGSRFQLLASHNVRAVTARNDINFDELMDTPTAFFISIPRRAAKRYRPLLACLMMQMFNSWEERGRTPNGVACYLDEFTNLGYIPGFAEFISTARSLRVSILMAIQSFSQLTERYDREDADTIKANAQVHLLLRGAGLEETKYYSERIGDTTILTETRTSSGSGSYRQETYTQAETRRRLYFANELRTMPENTILMLDAVSQPIMLSVTPFYADKLLAGRAYLSAVTNVRVEQEPEDAPPQQRAYGLPSPQPQVIVDADPDEEDDNQFFSP